MFRDLYAEPLQNPRLWMKLGWQGVLDSYRRSALGPLWIVLNLVIFSLAMGTIYGALFREETQDYVPYVTCGMMGWLWISTIVGGGANAFLGFSQFIQTSPINKSYFVWALAYKNLIILAHQFLVYAVLVVTGLVEINFYSLLIVPSIAFLFFSTIPLISILSIIYTRYRDAEKLVTSFIVVIMLTTPIFWKPEALSGWRTVLYHLNPFYYFVEFLRRPLLGEPYEPMIIWVTISLGLVLWLGGAMFFNRYSRYVIFWI